MKRFSRSVAVFFLLVLGAPASIAQYSGPAVETCRAYAERDIGRSGAQIKGVVLEPDRDLNIERYTRNVGNQFVASLLFGNGAVVYAGAPAVEMSFVCLLANEKRALFFHWLPRRDAPALAQCRRGGDAGALECLDALLLVAEQDLTQLYAKHYVDAREADTKAGNESASNAFRKSAEAWRAYRDAECARRAGAAAQKACAVELTRRRALDLQ
jgi:uncharacterized protein YecT (DUF1311 family)